ncbi:hypothetical protein [Sphingomonas sp. BK580]|nr:hypothetical protein [Sphingomonas sp. BK580]MBB3693183.1 hypothetical protein [Sphingomonas sp. BK580]
MLDQLSVESALIVFTRDTSQVLCIPFIAHFVCQAAAAIGLCPERG